MADATTIVESIQVDAATDAAAQVASVAVVGDSIIAAEVAQVEADLEAHAEASEERHVEILEGQQWLENQFQLLSSMITAQQAQLTAMQAQQTALQTTVTELLNLNLSSALNPSNPQASEPTPEAVVIVEPANESAVEDRREAEPEPGRRRRNRVV